MASNDDYDAVNSDVQKGKTDDGKETAKKRAVAKAPPRNSIHRIKYGLVNRTTYPIEMNRFYPDQYEGDVALEPLQADDDARSTQFWGGEYASPGMEAKRHSSAFVFTTPGNRGRIVLFFRIWQGGKGVKWVNRIRIGLFEGIDEAIPPDFVEQLAGTDTADHSGGPMERWVDTFIGPKPTELGKVRFTIKGIMDKQPNLKAEDPNTANFAFWMDYKKFRRETIRYNWFKPWIQDYWWDFEPTKDLQLVKSAEEEPKDPEDSEESVVP